MSSILRLQEMEMPWATFFLAVDIWVCVGGVCPARTA